MFTLYLVNFGYPMERTALTLEGAIAIAQSTCFEVRIDHDGKPVGWWGPIGGWHPYRA